MKFDFWMDWGRELSDAQFAAAWIALGIAAGAERKPKMPEGRAQRIGGDPALVPVGGTDRSLQVVQDAINAALMATHADGSRTVWRFPDPVDTVAAGGAIALAHIAPVLWAVAWGDVMSASPRQPRLCVRNAPEDEPYLPWLRLLGEAWPGPGAVSVEWAPPDPNLVFHWPLRLGAIAAEGNATIGAARQIWPSSSLTSSVSLGRDNANCDVLVHSGTVAGLIAALDALPFKCNANLVVVTAASDVAGALPAAQLHAVGERASASGIVLRMQRESVPETGAWLNAFVEEFSHDRPLDQALHVASKGRQSGSTAIWLADPISGLRLSAIAQVLVARAQALPPGTQLDASRLSPRMVQHATRASVPAAPDPPVPVPPPSFAPAPPMQSPAPAERVTADVATLQFDSDQLTYLHETDGASELVALGDAVESARPPAVAEQRRAARFLQQQAFIRSRGHFVPATSGFIAGAPARVRLRIGPWQENWQSAPTEFPQEALPAGYKEWRLTVWLTEPAQLGEPLRKSIVLPIDGPSTECEFRFEPRSAGSFEGRITVLHRGRVLQTAVLRASVHAAGASGGPRGSPVLDDLIPVRHRLGDLDGRRQFDLAFVTNHTEAGAPRAVALAADHAWIADLSKSAAVTADISTALSRLTKSVDDYADGLDGEEGRALLVELAKKGAWLNLYLVRQQIDRPGNRADVASNEYIQIVSTRTDATVPFEFIYDFEVPDDDALVCPRWRDALASGACPAGCTSNGGDAKHVCPLGFWGLRKVIERHQVSPELAEPGREIFLQSEPGRNTADLLLGGTALFASSRNVSAAAQKTVTAALRKKLGKTPATATTWADWPAAVTQAKPHLLVALPHTDGTGANVTLEIGGTTIGTIQVKPAHLRPAGTITHPLVALLGCDTAGTGNEYAEHVAVFRDRGAAVVIGTIATVLGVHAARAAILLTEALVPDTGVAPPRLGEAIRALRRRALLEGLLMPLCIVAYGDADWKLIAEGRE